MSAKYYRTRPGDNKSPKAVIFLHIPKAAGSTLLSILVRQYARQSVLPIYGDDSVRGMDAMEKIKDASDLFKQKIRVLAGHMKFGVHEYLCQETTYITFLRDPVERIVSHYYYVMRARNHYLHERVKTEISSLKEYVASGISDELNNGQTRLISGVGNSIPFGECKPELLVQAQKNLAEHFSVVGLSERFDESLFMMKNALGWKTPFYKKKNVAKETAFKRSIPEDTLETIIKYNELDLQLYKKAKQRFEEMLIEQGPSFKKDLKRFKLLNKHYGIIYTIKRKIKDPQNKILSIDSQLC